MMKLHYHLMALLIVFMTICSPAASGADSSATKTSPPVVSHDSQKAEEESAAEALPELYIPDKSYQFENVPAGQTVTHDFIIHNKGTAPLHITRVKTG